jgi:hypothetical protein
MTFGFDRKWPLRSITNGDSYLPVPEFWIPVVPEHVFASLCVVRDIRTVVDAVAEPSVAHRPRTNAREVEDCTREIDCLC